MLPCQLLYMQGYSQSIHLKTWVQKLGCYHDKMVQGGGGYEDFITSGINFLLINTLILDFNHPSFPCKSTNCFFILSFFSQKITIRQKLHSLQGTDFTDNEIFLMPTLTSKTNANQVSKIVFQSQRWREKLSPFYMQEKKFINFNNATRKLKVWYDIHL